MTGIPVIRAQYSKPSARTKYLILGSVKTRFSVDIGAKRTVSTCGGCMVMVSQPVKINRMKMTHPFQKQRQAALENMDGESLITVPAGNVKTSGPVANGWFERW